MGFLKSVSSIPKSKETGMNQPSQPSQSTNLRQPRVIVIGAGMTGILATIRLRRAGITDITVLEKAGNIGGTWRENTYPNVACDIPAHMYTYSFRPNPEWSNVFAKGDEIQAYFEAVAKEELVSAVVRFNEGVTDCVWRDGQAGGRWHVRTSAGNDYVADIVICATGILHEPAYPKIPGLESFAGTKFHTARWDHKADLTGKRVGIIGTGSTAAQVIPGIASKVGKLTVFQRTPHWVLPIGNRRYSDAFKDKCRASRSYTAKMGQRIARLFELTLTRSVAGSKWRHALLTWYIKRNLKKQVPDADLRRRLTPDYTVGCKRLIVSTEVLPALCRPNVVLEDEGIAAITATGVRTRSGIEHPLDVLILSTGFNPFSYMRPMNLLGRDGVSIEQAWAKKVKAYRSVCLPGFPNFFLMLGPHSPLSNYSVIAMSEVQMGYVMKLIEQWRAGQLSHIEATPAAQDWFMDYVKQGQKGGVRASGCKSWYLDKDGDVMVWPFSWEQFCTQMAQPDLTHFASATAST
jgi:cation diffusion facilitator CzcD-associated flavoprotein CzcO